jgi:hypothetical protein
MHMSGDMTDAEVCELGVLAIEIEPVDNPTT